MLTDDQTRRLAQAYDLIDSVYEELNRDSLPAEILDMVLNDLSQWVG